MKSAIKGWQKTQLGEFFRIKHGYAFKGQYFASKGPFVLLTPGNFYKEGGLKLKGEKEKYYTGEFPSDFLLRDGDLIVAMTDLTQDAAILGAPALVNKDETFLHNQRLGKITDLRKDRLDGRFLFHLFNYSGVRSQIKGSATGATVRHTAPERIYSVKINLPPLPTQRKIAAVLSAYDDLIENNVRRIAILEEMAAALYREWFIELRFPGHASVPVAESEQGRVPQGWAEKVASDVIEFDPTTKVPKAGEKPFVPMGSLSNNSLIISDVEQRAGNSGAKFKNGDTLFARITPCLENGKTGYVQFLPSDDAVAFGSTEFIVMRAKTISPEMAYLMARSDEFREHAIQSMSGATGRQRVHRACFDQFRFVQPDAATIAAFSEQVTPMFDSINLLAQRNANLRATRDLLLPKLVAGEVDVSQLAIAGATDETDETTNGAEDADF